MRGLWFVIIMAAAYLIGSISTAIIAGKIIAGDDIRTHGSGNAGATSVHTGKKPHFWWFWAMA